MPPERLPTHPPARALHFFRVQASGSGSITTNHYEPLCGRKPRAHTGLHGTTNRALVTCPQCQRLLRVRTEYAGKRIACKHCSHAFVAGVPAEAGQVGSARAAAAQAAPSPPMGCSVHPA